MVAHCGVGGCEGSGEVGEVRGERWHRFRELLGMEWRGDTLGLY